MFPIAWLYGLAVCLAAEAGGEPVAFEFHDAAAYEGRSVLQFRALEFRNDPVRPLAGDFQPAEGARYGLVPVGATPETALMIVWLPKGADGPEIWLDRNGNGRLTLDERHVMKQGQIEIPVKITIVAAEGDSPIFAQKRMETASGDAKDGTVSARAKIGTVPAGAPKRVQRTLIFRRSTLGDGLRYAVRGYAEGKLDLGGTTYTALLIDGNADGLFDTVGQDRLWIDLDEDGKFDLLSEQFLLGKPITKAKQVFVVSADATAAAVRVRQRSGVEGKLRLQMGANVVGKPSKISATLVSDFGELLVIDKLGAPMVVSAGDYYVSALRLEIPDAAGQTWTYSFFRYGKQELFTVPAGQEQVVDLCGKLNMEVTLRSASNGQARAAETLVVEPRLMADGSLYLSSASTGQQGSMRAAESSAEIVLLSADGKEVNRGITGFS